MYLMRELYLCVPVLAYGKHLNLNFKFGRYPFIFSQTVYLQNMCIYMA